MTVHLSATTCRATKKMEVQMSGGDVVEIGERIRGRRSDEDVAG
jgi:hypothetical protein